MAENEPTHLHNEAHMRKNDESSVYALSLALIVGFALVAGALWFSIGALNNSVADLNKTVLEKQLVVNSGTGNAGNNGGTGTGTGNNGGTPAPSAIVVDVSGQPIRGATNAKVTVLEFSDFECPFCQAAYPTVKQIEGDYSGKINLVFMQFPLTSLHPDAEKAAEASECAYSQGKFWEYYDALFTDKNLSIGGLEAEAQKLGLNTATFNTCLDSGQKSSLVSSDEQAGITAGVQGTPSFIIGTMSNNKVTGQLFVGAQPYANFKAALDAALAG